ncbi:ferredoxin [Streptomyces sp. MUSC 14]|uniref:ferredoxin n=1 Tax=Streptomyces sp. MUSC 14 TaxID=1354889 RepID=UPI0009A0B419|nr:ferredoxin [Streptomyces sp. MUSC 14]
MLTGSAGSADPTGLDEAPPDGLRLVVDLNRCQSYGQCVYAAPTVFRFHGEEALEYDYAPIPALRHEVERAAAACPVQAITLGRATEPAPVALERVR